MNTVKSYATPEEFFTAEQVVRRVLSRKNIQRVTRHSMSITVIIAYFSLTHAADINRLLAKRLPNFKFRGPFYDSRTKLMRLKLTKTRSVWVGG